MGRIGEPKREIHIPVPPPAVPLEEPEPIGEPAALPSEPEPVPAGAP